MCFRTDSTWESGMAIPVHNPLLLYNLEETPMIYDSLVCTVQKSQKKRKIMLILGRAFKLCFLIAG